MLTTNNNRFENENEQWWEKKLCLPFLFRNFTRVIQRDDIHQNERACNVDGSTTSTGTSKYTCENTNFYSVRFFFLFFWLWSIQVWMNREYHVMIRNKRLIVSECVCLSFSFCNNLPIWIMNLYFIFPDFGYLIFFVWQRRRLFAWLCYFNS